MSENSLSRAISAFENLKTVLELYVKQIEEHVKIMTESHTLAAEHAKHHEVHSKRMIEMVESLKKEPK